LLFYYCPTIITQAKIHNKKRRQHFHLHFTIPFAQINILSTIDLHPTNIEENVIMTMIMILIITLIDCLCRRCITNQRCSNKKTNAIVFCEYELGRNSARIDHDLWSRYMRGIVYTDPRCQGFPDRNDEKSRWPQSSDQYNEVRPRWLETTTGWISPLFCWPSLFPCLQY
jgi:hypothetical protein